ncbi:MAG: phage tail protein [Myxococcota bacterium]
MRRTGTWMLRRLPGLYAARDAQQKDAPLRRLLDVLGGALDNLEQDVRQLGSDAFVERASAEALPLIAERLGVHLTRRDTAVMRGVLARGVHWRRARGSLATIEDVVAVTTGWTAEVEEGFRSVLVNQDIHHPLTWRGRSPVIRSPVLLADPLSRRAQPPQDILDPGLSASATWSALPGEGLDAALRRLGGADAGRQALLPRTLDLRGAVRPDVLLVRTTRFVELEREGLRVGPIRRPPLLGGGEGVVFAFDPDERTVPLAWRPAVDREVVPSGLGPRHERGPTPTEARRHVALLTPTALAEAADTIEAAGAIAITLDGIPLVGPPLARAAPTPAPLAPLPRAPLLRFCDPTRMAASDTWSLHLIGATGTETEVMRADLGGLGGTHVVAPPPAGSTVRLRLTRGASSGHARAADGTWAPLAVGTEPGVPRSNAVVLAGVVYRFVAVAQTLRLRSLGGADWADETVLGALPIDTIGLVLATDGTGLFLVAPDGEQLGAWRLTPGVGGWAVERCDTTAGRVPAAAYAPGAVVAGDRLYVHGGQQGEAVLADTWSVPLAGGAWRRERWRLRPQRAGASLSFEAGRIWLAGGWITEDHLEAGVWSIDPNEPRGAWVAAPPLPIEAGGPGVLAIGPGPSVLVWADRLRPSLATLGPRDWTLREEDGPPPPAFGELAVDGDRFVIVGACPLRAPTVAVGAAGRSLLAFLPDIDTRAGETVAFDVFADGSSALASGEVAPPPRPGGRATPLAHAPAPAPRHGVVGRWAWRPYTVGHRSLLTWAGPLAPQPEGTVGVDPFLGRAMLSVAPAFDDARASTRIGRPGAVGAGTARPDRMPTPEWLGPDTAPPPFDRAFGLPVEAWVSPDEAPFGVLAGLPVHDSVEAALASTTGLHPVVAIRGSPTLPAARLGARTRDGFTLRTADARACPRFEADADGVSLGLHPAGGGHAGADAWLAGLWLAGMLEVAATDGEVDVRFCTLGLPRAPGQLGLRVLGAGHLARTSRGGPPVPISLEVRLYGCLVGAVELPPWVRFVAAGCTFDGGGGDGGGGAAIVAGGADVRLRHCTVRGRIEAGELRASSCVLSGAVDVDRPDVGWIRHSVAPATRRAPQIYRCTTVPPNFLSVLPEDPLYLRLADDPRLLAQADEGRTPGAWHDQAERLDELARRTDESIPMGMLALHDDRSLTERARALRRTP